jgi:hypothetical protein
VRVLVVKGRRGPDRKQTVKLVLDPPEAHDIPKFRRWVHTSPPPSQQPSWLDPSMLLLTNTREHDNHPVVDICIVHKKAGGGYVVLWFQAKGGDNGLKDAKSDHEKARNVFSR